METRILCYGDSNTWGYIGGCGERYPKNIRWTGRLQTMLGDGYEVIEEGLNGRTTVWEDPVEMHRNGSPYLAPCLDSHKPLDLVILMLGTNDLKIRFHLPARDIAYGAMNCAKVILQSQTAPGKKAPRLLFVSPPHIGENLAVNYFIETLGPESVEKSRQLAHWYEFFAQQMGVEFLDAALYAHAGTGDAIHIDEASHARLADAFYKKIKEMGL